MQNKPKMSAENYSNCTEKNPLLSATQLKVLVVYVPGHSKIPHLPKGAELGCVIKT